MISLAAPAGDWAPPAKNIYGVNSPVLKGCFWKSYPVCTRVTGSTCVDAPAGEYVANNWAVGLDVDAGNAKAVKALVLISTVTV